MEFKPTGIPEVVIVEPRVFSDARGFFLETFRANAFADHGIPGPFVQDNHSGSQGNALRGLHYQLKQAQGKLVRVLSGEIFDVAVDLRRRSPTFGRFLRDLSRKFLKIEGMRPRVAHGAACPARRGPAALRFACQPNNLSLFAVLF